MSFTSPHMHKFIFSLTKFLTHETSIYYPIHMYFTSPHIHRFIFSLTKSLTHEISICKKMSVLWYTMGQNQNCQKIGSIIDILKPEISFGYGDSALFLVNTAYFFLQKLILRVKKTLETKILSDLTTGTGLSEKPKLRNFNKNALCQITPILHIFPQLYFSCIFQ